MALLLEVLPNHCSQSWPPAPQGQRMHHPLRAKANELLILWLDLGSQSALCSTRSPTTAQKYCRALWTLFVQITFPFHKLKPLSIRCDRAFVQSVSKACKHGSALKRGCWVPWSLCSPTCQPPSPGLKPGRGRCPGNTTLHFSHYQWDWASFYIVIAMCILLWIKPYSFTKKRTYLCSTGYVHFLKHGWKAKIELKL